MQASQKNGEWRVRVPLLVVSALMAEARTTGRRVRYESAYTRHDGSRGWLRSYGEAIYEHGECVAIRGAAMDITEEKAAEQMLKLMEVMDEHEDVQKVHANFDIPDEVMEKMAAAAAG